MSDFVENDVDFVFVGNKAKRRTQNGCYKKTKDAKNYEKQTFLTRLRTRICAYQGVRNDRFSENLTCFAFL